MTLSHLYKAKSFDLRGLHGTSDITLTMHFKLYEGYVQNVNLLRQMISSEKEPASTDTLQRLNYEYGGMKLHEYYFENLKCGDKESQPGPLFTEKVHTNFTSYQAWQADFTNAITARGVGWAVCCTNPTDGKLSNHRISLHDLNSLANLQIILVVDIWEHAFIFDYQPSEREQYIKDFFANVNWTTVETRLQLKKAGDLYE